MVPCEDHKLLFSFLITVQILRNEANHFIIPVRFAVASGSCRVVQVHSKFLNKITIKFAPQVKRRFEATGCSYHDILTPTMAAMTTGAENSIIRTPPRLFQGGHGRKSVTFLILLGPKASLPVLRGC